jgi:hypothetical protein
MRSRTGPFGLPVRPYNFSHRSTRPAGPVGSERYLTAGLSGGDDMPELAIHPDARCIEPEEEFLRALYERHGPMLPRFATRIQGRSASAAVSGSAANCQARISVSWRMTSARCQSPQRRPAVKSHTHYAIRALRSGLNSVASRLFDGSSCRAPQTVTLRCRRSSTLAVPCRKPSTVRRDGGMGPGIDQPIDQRQLSTFRQHRRLDRTDSGKVAAHRGSGSRR